jgi:hypothetical protein
MLKIAEANQICYSVGCNNHATISLRIPLSSTKDCIIHVCVSCLPKYELDDSDTKHRQHSTTKTDDKELGHKFKVTESVA